MRGILYSLLALLTALLGAVISLPAPTEAQGVVVWNTEYYNNTTFTAPVVLTKSYSLALFAFTWGAGSPETGVNADNFSARFSAITLFNAGTYRFALRADQRATLFLNNTQILTTANAGVNVTVTVDVVIAQGNQTLRVDYVEETGDASVSLSWALANQVPGTATATITPGPSPTPTVAGGTGGTAGGGSTTTSQWTVNFYANFSLSGTPVLSTTVASPSIDWGLGSPAASVPVDNFSARFTAIENFTAGVYRFEVRSDDGVRVTVAGLLVIDHWYPHEAFTTYVANVYVNGPSSVTIDYYEATGGASLFYSVSRAPDGTPTSVSYGTYDPNYIPIGATARVTAGTLNVRSLPGLQGQVLTKVYFGENYVVIGTNADRSWYQIRVGIIEGWVNAQFVRISNPSNVQTTSPTNASSQVANPVAVPPQVPAPAVNAPAPTGFTLMATANLIIRSSDTVRSSRRGIVAAGGTASILGRNSTNTWWYIEYNGQIGWVSATYVILQPGIDLNRIPIVAV